MNIRYGSAGSWIIAGIASGHGPELIFGQLIDLEYSVNYPTVSMSSSGSPLSPVVAAPQVSVKAELVNPAQLAAPTFGECLRLLATQWDPDAGPVFERSDGLIVRRRSGFE